MKAFLFGLFAIALPCFGSTVVVWLTAEGIIAAADSLERAEDKYSASQEVICKIQPLGRYFFASTGYTRMHLEGKSEELLYSSYDIAKTLAQESDGIDAFSAKFIEVMKPKLRTAMTAALRSDRQHFMTNINGKGGTVAATVFGLEDGQFKVALISFTATAVNASEVKIQESVQRCPGEAGCDLARGIFAQLGVRDFLGEKLEPNPKTLEEAVPWAASLIEAEIEGDRLRSERDKSPRKVDSPTVILTVRPSGARWADGYQGTCPNLAK